MGNGAELITFGIALVVFAITLIVAKLGRSFMRYNDKTRTLAANMRHAKDQQEYLYWRRELLWHYLHLIPCMTKTGMNKLCAMFRRGKHHDDAQRSDGLAHILAPSVAGLCICALTLCGVSYAWFTATVSSGAGTIQAAQYGVKVTIVEEGSTDTPATQNVQNTQAFTATLDQGKTYEVTLEATGTATSGYCSVVLEDTDKNTSSHYTGQFVPNSTMTFTVDADKDYTLTITPQWGSCAVKEGDLSLKDKDTIGTLPKNGSSVEDGGTPAGDAAGQEQTNGKTADDAQASGDDGSTAAPVNSDTPKNDDAISTPKNDDTVQSSSTSSAETGNTESSTAAGGTAENDETSVTENDISSPAATDPQQQN